MNNKRGQLTIFIIIAIIIVASIIAFFLYYKPETNSLPGQKLDIANCIEEGMASPIQELSLKAGIIKPTFNTQYLDENITVICYTDEYHKPCIVQQPFLKQTFEKNLAILMQPKIKACYDNSIADLKANGYDVIPGEIKYTLEIVPAGIEMKIDAPTTIRVEGTGQTLPREIDLKFPSQIYDVLTIANSILQFETSYGDSEVSSFMFYYPDLNIQKIRREEGMKIYIISDKKEIKYTFASRSYAWPPGYGVY